MDDNKLVLSRHKYRFGTLSDINMHPTTVRNILERANLSGVPGAKSLVRVHPLHHAQSLVKQVEAGTIDAAFIHTYTECGEKVAKVITCPRRINRLGSGHHCLICRLVPILHKAYTEAVNERERTEAAHRERAYQQERERERVERERKWVKQTPKRIALITAWIMWGVFGCAIELWWRHRVSTAVPHTTADDYVIINFLIHTRWNLFFALTAITAFWILWRPGFWDSIVWFVLGKKKAG